MKFDDFQGYPGRTQVERTQRKVTRSSPGQVNSKQLPNPRLLTCKLLKADTRLANWQLQIAGMEKTGEPDCQLPIARTGRTWHCQFAKCPSQLGGPLKGAGGFMLYSDVSQDIGHAANWSSVT